MFRDAGRAIRLVASALSCARFDTTRMAERALEGWITVTELADTLARDYGVSFKAGHTIASRLIAAVSAGRQGSLASLLRDISADVLGRPVEIDDAALAVILSPQHFVEVRTTPGGPAPSRIAEAIEESTGALGRDRGWFEAAAGRLTAAEGLLKAAAENL
jgi:argininosuccinate lyase